MMNPLPIRRLVPAFLLAAGLPTTATARITLFADTFDRPDAADPNASAAGITNNTGSDLSAGAWTEAYGPARTAIAGGRLHLAIGNGTSNTFVNHNFVNPEILAGGGFSISIEIGDATDSNLYEGGAVAIGLSAAEAAAALDAHGGNPRLTNFTRNDPATDTVLGDFWFGWRGNGRLVFGRGQETTGTRTLAEGTVVLTANFTFDSFADGAAVHFEVLANGVAPNDNPVVGAFAWSGANQNHIALDARDGTLVAFDNLTVTAPGPADSRPNVVVILADDTGWSDYGCYGSFIRTPHIDSLAAGGVRFRDFYQAARCSTTRNALLTGLYTQQSAVDPGASLPNLKTHTDVGANNVTIAEVLAAAGFRTYMAGKWHLGTTANSRDPRSRGFQHVFGQGLNGDASNSGDPFGYWDQSLYHLVNDPEITPLDFTGRQFHYTDAIGDYAVEFLSHHASKGDGAPFFLYLAFNAPHWPVCAPATLANQYTDVADPNPGDTDVVRYEDGWDVLRQQTHANQLAAGVIAPHFALSHKGDQPEPANPIDDWSSLAAAQRDDLARRMALYAAMIEQVDQNIGKLLARLQQLGRLDDTLVILCNDNGANYEGGEFGNSNSSDFVPWAAADLPHMGQPQNDNNAGYPRVNQGGAWANLSNTPFRLFKHFTHEGGIRTPAIVHWPAATAPAAAGSWTDERGHLVDIMATVIAATGTPYPAAWAGHAVAPMEGTSLLPVLAGQPLAPTGHRAGGIGIEHESNRAWFSGKWKFVTKNFALSDGSSPAHELELYDMQADPAETTNLAAANPDVLAAMIDQWNAWATRVGVPTARLIAPPLPQSDPPALAGDLFVDTFNRPNHPDPDASTEGMWGPRLTAMGPGAVYYDSHVAGETDVAGQALHMAISSAGMTENGIQHNFIGPDILAAGGFSVSLRVDAILHSGALPDPGRFGGFGVGLSQAEAQISADIGSTTPPLSFRGNGSGNGTADLFLDLDIDGNVKAYRNGTLVATTPVGANTGTLLACFACTSFDAGATVTVTTFHDGRPVDLDPAGPGITLSFPWDGADANYIGLSARANARVELDNLAVRTLPPGDALAAGYAMAAGLSGANAAPGADPDHDGDDTATEWLKGGNPNASDAAVKLLWLAPTPSGEFRFNWFRRNDAQPAGVTYSFLHSTDLAHWTAFTPLELSATPSGPDHQLVLAQVPDPDLAGQGRLFVLLRADH